MAKAFTPKVLTANDLLLGDVIYVGTDKSWTRELQNARIFTDEADANVALEQANTQAHIAVGAYLVDALESATGPQPAHFREDFRRTGPSNYAHGKQETRPAGRVAA